MKKFYRGSLATCLLLIMAFAAHAQTNISGKVVDFASGESLAGVNIIVKGRVIGTITDANGQFSLKVNDSPPFALVISFVGYRSVEKEITEANVTGLKIELEEQTILGQEIVVSASRVEESILESPVAIEKMDILQVQNTPADNYYKAIANLKGVDVATSSINFQIINTRGFGSTGNTRFVQLTDGMDTQAPALNFPIGNLNGPSELDVESVELIPGAASALYGPNAFNGVLLVNSKNAFEYQGLSAFMKAGVNHIGANADFNGPAPLWEGALRYAKAFGNKFAFKVNLAAMQAQDWHGTDATDRERARTPEGFSFNPGADRLHFMGDEASINLAIFQFSSNWLTFAGSNSQVQRNIFGDFSARDYALAGDLPNHVISVTPYAERDLIDYNAKNYKANVGLYYRLNDRVELSYLYNAGFGTSIYTGAQRYSLKNFGIQQHRLQLRGDNFYVRAYTTMEDSGDSYITEFLAKRINDVLASSANGLFDDVEGYLATYPAEYLRYLYMQGLAPGQINGLPETQRLSIQQAAHEFARNEVNNGSSNPAVYGTRRAMHPDVNSADFQRAKAQASSGTVPNGPRFDDKTNLYHAEFQYDFKNEIDFMELQIGGSYRLFDLNSNGTIFDDAVENITISEYGAYASAGKWLGDRKFKLSGSIRYDKNQNFEGRFNPRLSGVYKLGKNHNLRISYQTGFRIPSTQGQHIDLSILTARLLGGLPRYAEKYDLVRTSTTGAPLTFDGVSVQRFRDELFRSGNINSAVANLVPYTEFKPVRPESVQNIELGYKSVIDDNLLIDFSYYYNIYNDFITQIRVVTASQNPDGSPNYLTMLNGSAHTVSNDVVIGNTSQVYSNFDGQITSQGAVLGLTYNLPKNYTVGTNYNWNVINDTPSDFLTEFNTPEHKFNIQFGNRKLTDNLGFNVTYRWQDEFEWQSSFTIPANGMVPAYSTVDAQVTYKLSPLKSVLKIGGSNLLNQKYIQSLGGPNIGALYYVSLTFDQLMR